jgi:hypothetical protein
MLPLMDSSSAPSPRLQAQASTAQHSAAARPGNHTDHMMSLTRLLACMFTIAPEYFTDTCAVVVLCRNGLHRIVCIWL